MRLYLCLACAEFNILTIQRKYPPFRFSTNSDQADNVNFPDFWMKFGVTLCLHTTERRVPAGQGEGPRAEWRALPT